MRSRANWDSTEETESLQHGCTIGRNDEWPKTPAQLRGDEAERPERGSAGKEHERPENEPEPPESENEQQESAHGRNAPDDQDDDIGCI